MSLYGRVTNCFPDFIVFVYSKYTNDIIDSYTICSTIFAITAGSVITASAIFIAIVLNACMDIIPNLDAPFIVASHTDLGLMVFKN